MSAAMVEVLDSTTNAAIVRMPGRSFPGVVIQGDSLKILVDLAGSIFAKAAEGRCEGLVEEAEELASSLERQLRHYEAVLRGHGLTLPYVTSTGPS